MRKCENISPYMRRPLVIYDFATAPLWISLYSIWGKFDFLFYQCGMGSKSTQARCCPRCIKCLFKDIRSALTPSPPPHSPFSNLLFWKLTDRCKCAQPIGEIFPIPPLSICSGDGWLTTELTLRWGWVIVNSSIRSHFGYTSLSPQTGKSNGGT